MPGAKDVDHSEILTGFYLGEKYGSSIISINVGQPKIVSVAARDGVSNGGDRRSQELTLLPV